MTTNSFKNIPDSFILKWQEIADLLANILKIPAALIMKTENEFMEVFISSKTEHNPYKVGDKEHWHGLYCETVIKTQNKLYIPNALKDVKWDKNPDIKLGMIAYLGIPINFPDNQPFGTICVLDNKENEFTVEISIADSGVGMDADKLQNLFDITTLRKTSGTQNEQGTGLGLMLCKEFIAKNPGRMKG